MYGVTISIAFSISKFHKKKCWQIVLKIQKQPFHHTHKKASCVIFASETGKGPDKLLLFSLLQTKQYVTYKYDYYMINILI
jgi:hypothetical protein